MNIEQIKQYPDKSRSLDISNLLEKYDFYNAVEILKICCNKIGIGNTLTISGTDIFSITYNYIFGIITEEQMNKELFSKKSLHNAQEITQFLLMNKFTIEKKDIHLGPFKSNFIIEAKRNG